MRKGFIVILAVLLMTGVASAQMGLGLGGGITQVSKIAGEDVSDYVGMGFNGHASFFIPMGEKLHIGIHGKFNLIPIDTDAILEDMEDADDVSVDASLNIIEILPSIRYYLGETFFAQVGGGLYIYKLKVTAEFMGFEMDVADESESDFGVTFGFGINLGNLYILPMYHMVFTEVENTSYFNVNVGINL